MDFLSKLLKTDRKDVEKAARGLLNNLIGNTPSNPPAADSGKNAAKPASGFSWGEQMPEEENQYNYNGTFTEYFENIFRAELPQYRMNRSIPSNSKRVIYTFFSGASAALVIELMSDGCYAKKVREDCERGGIPYLRFYYDHPGWWNTRAYVEKRIRDAVGR